MLNRNHILLFIVFALIFCSTVSADSTASLIEKGNRSWLSGDFDTAIKIYDEAAVNDPESPYIYFNKGTALYKKGDFVSAIDEFEMAALKSKIPEMESKARFNLGNCTFREAERQMDSDLNKALEQCQKSIIHYQDALKLNPEFKNAAENIEIVRLLMKNILDEIKKQQEQAKQQEQQAKENAEELNKIIERQEKTLSETRETSNSKKSPSEKKKAFDKIADEQKDIREDTQKLADKITQQAAQQQQAQENPAITHLNNAVKEQEASEGNLRNSAVDLSEKNQENAIKELKEALKPPEQDKNNQQQQGQQNQQGQNQQKDQGKQGQDQQKDQQQENGESEQEQSSQAEEEQARFEEAGEEAQNILDEEKRNQKRRQMVKPFGYRDVEKDW